MTKTFFVNTWCVVVTCLLSFPAQTQKFLSVCMNLFTRSVLRQKKMYKKLTQFVYDKRILLNVIYFTLLQVRWIIKGAPKW